MTSEDVPKMPAAHEATASIRHHSHLGESNGSPQTPQSLETFVSLCPSSPAPSSAHRRSPHSRPPEPEANRRVMLRVPGLGNAAGGKRWAALDLRPPRLCLLECLVTLTLQDVKSELWGGR